MAIRSQKDTLLFKEEGTSTKPCVSSTSETETTFHFERPFLVEAKYFNSFVGINYLLQKVL